MGRYRLRCLQCNRIVEDHYTLGCHDNALLRTEYAKRTLTLKNLPGIWQFHDWLPVSGSMGSGDAPVTYRSYGFAQELGLHNLYISFSGYLPERGAFIKTCSFKELESPATLQRSIEHGNKTFVVSSAGNTARAFAQTASEVGLPLVIVIPVSCMNRLWITNDVPDNIRVIAVDGDYYDAIMLGNRVGSIDGFRNEGGAKNVARRDGMGIVMLDAVLRMKTLPRHYFQAIGSGTGGIAAWEASIRLIRDGRFGDRMPHLHLAQSSPFAPIFNAWSGNRNVIAPEDVPAKSRIEETYTDILSNRNPPYGIKGGVADALSKTDGQVYAIENDEARDAKQRFEAAEGVDILRPAAIAVAALCRAVDTGAIDPDDTILLNITGGGLSRLKEDYSPNHLGADLVVDVNDLNDLNDSTNGILDEIMEIL